MAAGDTTLILSDERTEARDATRTEAAFDIAPLVGEYGPLLFRVAASILRNAAEAEDVVQDTFVRVLEHRGKLPAVRDLRVWLVRIAWNLALDRRRRVRPEQMDALFAASLAGTEAAADRALADARALAVLLEQMATLPKDERHALELSGIDELSTAEIAGVLKRSESATRALLFRARQRLRERMEQAQRNPKRGGTRR